MSDTAYRALQESLDRYPLGFPSTESGVEIEILKRLFTEEQARLAVRLSPFLEEAGQIAERLEMEVQTLAEELEEMVRKGLVFRVQRQGIVAYRAAPFMIGLYEYSIKRIDKELAALYAEYYETAYVDEMGASGVPGFKVIPVAENVEANSALLPYHKLEESVRAARKIAVTDCVCRKESSLLGQRCDHPMETCLSFGAAADYYIESGLGREIRADEAIRILEQADESGLVHAGANSKHLSNICNCCPCCCASMKGITRRGYDKHKYLNAIFEATVEPAECSACDLCVDRCPVGAIAVEDTADVDRSKCLGCGLCASVCPTEAIRLLLRPDREEPFDGISEMGREILKAKQAKAEKSAESA
jgi:ferredoxin